MNSSVKLSPKSVTKFLTLLMLFIVGMDFLRLFLKKVQPDWNAINELLDSLFKLTGEYNVASLYSSLIILLASVFLFLIFNTTEIKNHRIYWATLGFIFIFLACDESFKIHEGLSQIIRGNTEVTGSIKYGTWALPYLFLTAIVGLLYARFVFSLPKQTKILIILSGAIYVGGAGGFELIEGYLFKEFGEESIVYKLIHSTQEILEMIGMILFNYTLLDYLSVNKTTIEISTPTNSTN